MNNIKAVQADITQLDVGAIVNAANESLLAGGGVCGAIHRAAGPKLQEECMTLNGCKTGHAKITKGYNLPARHVIHTVGPVWHGGNQHEPESLASCYRESLQLAAKNGLKTIAFPAISTGIFGYPLEKATKIAVTEVTKFLEKHPEIEFVCFACFDQAILQAYQNELNHHQKKSGP